MAVVVAGVIVVVVRDRSGPGSPTGPEPVSLTVMTRNLYLGGDITRPVRAAQGRSGAEALLALGHANRELRDIVDRTDFRVRSRLLAAEVAAARPDLVGLQEVALWRHGPLELDRVGRLDASEVDLDFLDLLLTALEAHGTAYDVVRVQEESDVEAPAFTGSPLDATLGAAADVRLTLRDVILVRRGSPAEVTASGSQPFRTRLTGDLGGVPFVFARGAVWADVTLGSNRLRFVTTHLESQSPEVAQAQATELVDGPALDTDRPVVLVGDLNSDPTDTTVGPGHRVAEAAAYEELTGRGRLVDAAAAVSTAPAATGVLSELLDDASAAGLDRRLDLVLTRGGVAATRAEVTGDDPADRDPATGLWPSDHAGVVVGLESR